MPPSGNGNNSYKNDTGDLFTSLYGVYDEVYELPKGASAAQQPSAHAAPGCECGMSTVLGAQDNPEFHSDWCPIYRKRGSV